MELFETILNKILNESVDEAIVNPIDTTKDIFKCQPTSKGDKIVIRADLSKDDVAEIAKFDNNLIVKQWVGVVVTADDLNNPQSQGYNNILKLCDAVSKLGKYGEINPEEVVDEAKFNLEQTITPEKRKETETDENELWNEFVNKFDDPRIQQLLQSFHTYLPLESLDHKFSDLNLTKILSQDAKRIQAGKQPATFVASPQDWRLKYNRRIRRDAIPFYLYYPKYKDDVADEFYDAHAIKVFGNDNEKILGGLTARQYDRKLERGGSKTYGPHRNFKYGARQEAGPETKFYYAPFYDIADTEPINGLEDKWNDPERQGVIDNIRWKPTEASMGKIGDNLGISKDEIESAMGGVDNEYTIKCYYALKNLCLKVDDGDLLYKEVRGILDKKTIPTDSEGKYDMDAIKNDVFTLITALVATILAKEYSIAKPDTRLTMARMVACMFVGAHRIAPEKAITIFRGLNKDEINTKAEDLNFNYKTIYRKLTNSINSAIKMQYGFERKQPRKAMEENIGHTETPMENFYSEIDNIFNTMAIDKNGEDTISPEEQQLAEAKFYRMYNKIAHPNF
jgi:hypothetical protein